jgi:hypothetical protein
MLLLRVPVGESAEARMMRAAQAVSSALLALGVGLAAGCSSGNMPKSSATTCTPPCGGSSSSGGDASAPPNSTNPDGVPYPTPALGFGRTARSGNTPGDLMQNFKFFGYVNGDVSQGEQLIALADFFDPMNKRYKVLRINASAVWCPPCNQETDAVVAAKSQLDAEGVVFLQTLFDGAVMGTPATQNDLNGWIKKHGSTFDSVLDPGLQNLGGFFQAAAIPWNADLDVRSMEILDESLGWGGDILGDVQPALDWVSSHPPTSIY